MKINMTREGLLEFVRNLRSQWGFAPVSRNQIAKEWVEAIDAAADVIETLTGGPLSDIEKVQHMEKCNWKPASTYWMERAIKAEKALGVMQYDRDEWRQRAADRCTEAESWFRKYGAEQERADNTQRALDALQHASDGFAEAVRQESGKAYPWPAFELAVDMIGALDTGGPDQTAYILWEGGDRPVDPDAIVDVKIASGVPRVPVRAGEWPQICWRHRPVADPKSGWNIVAYRVVG